VKSELSVIIGLFVICLLLGSSYTSFDLQDEIQSKEELGKKLFFDPILSLDQSISCASCHKPEFAFADNQALSLGVDDSLGVRNTPSVMNMLSRPYFFYDGRSATLEAQAIGPIENPFDCHFGPDFTGDEFRNVGLYDGVTLVDQGRFDITNDSTDLGKFKVPGLRNVALTAPYMHNGMMETLEEVIDFYSNPYEFVATPINMDTTMLEPLNFTDQQKTDLVNFLHSLTDMNIP